MAWTDDDIKKYINEEMTFIMSPKGYGKEYWKKQMKEREQMNIKYITINYIDSKYQIQIKREK